MPSSINGPAVNAFEQVVSRLGSSAAGFDLRLLVPMYLDRSDYDSIPAEVLAHVAWGLDIDIFGLPRDLQVSCIKRAIELHRRKGTRWAIRKELEVLGFIAVSVKEGNVSDFMHDGTVMHNGAYPHGGLRQDWAVFSVNMLGVRGFDARRVLPAIARAKNARSKLISLSISLRYFMSLSSDLVDLVVNCADGGSVTAYSPDGYMFSVNVPESYADREILGLTALDADGEPCGSVVFPDPVIRGGYAVRIYVDVDRNLGVSADFDDSVVDFDDPITQIDD